MKLVKSVRHVAIEAARNVAKLPPEDLDFRQTLLEAPEDASPRWRSHVGAAGIGVIAVCSIVCAWGLDDPVPPLILCVLVGALLLYVGFAPTEE